MLFKSNHAIEALMKFGNKVRTFHYLFPFLASLITSTILARSLGPSDRGVYASLANILLILAIFFGAGMDTAITTSLSAKIYLGQIIYLFKKKNLFFIFIPYVFTLFILILFYLKYLTLIWILFIPALIPILILYNLIAGWARNQGLLDVFGYLQSMPAIFRIIFIVFIIEFTSINIGFAVFFMTLANFPYLLYLLARNSREISVNSLTDNLTLRMGLRALPTTFLSVLVYRLDQIMGLSIIGSWQLGIYATAVTIAEIPLIVSRSFRDVLYSKNELDFSKLRKIGFLKSLVVVIIGLALVPFLYVPIFGISYQHGIIVTECMLLVVIVQILYEYSSIQNLRRQSYAPITTSQVIYLILTFSVVTIFRNEGALSMVFANFIGYSGALLYIQFHQIKYAKGKHL